MHKIKELIEVNEFERHNHTMVYVLKLIYLNIRNYAQLYKIFFFVYARKFFLWKHHLTLSLLIEVKTGITLAKL